MRLTKYLLTILAISFPSFAQNAMTEPITSRNMAAVNTPFSADNWANIRYVGLSWNWVQTPTDSLVVPGTKTVHLTPCPHGIDTSSNAHYSYTVRIAGTGTEEVAMVIGGTCNPGASSGTIVLTTANGHAGGYTVGSASSGIQEAWNDAWVNDTGTAPNAASQTAPYVKLLADTTYRVYATIYLRGRGGILDGAGALITCSTRDRCIYIGTTQARPYVDHHKLYNVSGTSTVDVDGVQVSSVSVTAGTYKVIVGAAHPFVVGDTVDCEYHSQTMDQHWASRVLTVPNSTSFTVKFGTSTAAAGANTFGFCNLLNAFIEDNSDHAVVQDINLFQSNPVGLGYFTYGIVNDNDQQFIVERATNRSSIVLKATPNWPIGAFLYERTDQGNAGITYLHNSEITNVNCATGGGNGMVITDTVCQGFPTYGIRYFGGLQSATFQNIYQESTGGTKNPLYGYAAQSGYVLQGMTQMLGNFPVGGYSPTFLSAKGGGAAAVRNYFVVPRSSTLGIGPMLYIGRSNPNDSGGVNVTLKWPSPELWSAGTITFDLLVTTGAATAPPIGTGKYAVGTGISFESACGTNGMCSFVDTQASPATYGVGGDAPPWGPTFWFWPANLAINYPGIIFLPSAGTVPSAVASVGARGVSIIAERCSSFGPPAQRSPIWIQCNASDGSGGSGTIATVLQQIDLSRGGPSPNSKGRLNFGMQIGAPNDLLTLQDSNFAKTISTSGERPPNDPGDMAIGLDQAGGLAVRSATSISSYIDAIPRGANYQERLTSSMKSFNVPIQTVPADLRSLPKCIAGTEGSMRAVNDSTTTSWGATVNGGGSNHVLAYCDGTNWTVAAK